MKTYPDTFEVDRLYDFERIHHGHPEGTRLIVFDDGSARIIGALNCGYDNGPQAWKSAVRHLKEEGFEFKEAGKKVRLEDFPPLPGEDVLDAFDRYAKALRS